MSAEVKRGPGRPATGRTPRTYVRMLQYEHDALMAECERLGCSTTALLGERLIRLHNLPRRLPYIPAAGRTCPRAAFGVPLDALTELQRVADEHAIGVPALIRYLVSHR